MAVRFIDTSIWSEDWFCELGAEYQSFWNYITCNCDNAGIWRPNKIDFEIKSRTKINMVEFIKKINESGMKERIFITEAGRWFLTGFIAFQWFNKKSSFDLVLTNKLHSHIHELIIKNSIPLKKIRGLKEVLVDLQGQVIGNVDVKVEKGGVGGKTFELTDADIGKTIEYLHFTAQIKLSDSQILDYWKAFQIHTENGQHGNKADKVQHFRNWLKIQKINAKQPNSIENFSLERELSKAAAAGWRP